MKKGKSAPDALREEYHHTNRNPSLAELKAAGAEIPRPHPPPAPPIPHPTGLRMTCAGRANTPEGEVIRAVDDWLEARGIPHWRINTGALKNENGRLVRFGKAGMSDFHATYNGFSVWIECKRPKGGVVSDAQRSFLDCINGNGGVGIVVNSIESLEIQLKKAGVIA